MSSTGTKKPTRILPGTYAGGDCFSRAVALQSGRQLCGGSRPHRGWRNVWCNRGLKSNKNLPNEGTVARRFHMQGTVFYGPRDIRFENRPEPTITKPTDAIIRLSATCICGSDLWPYRGIQPIAQPTPMGHEYCGIVSAARLPVTQNRPFCPILQSIAIRCISSRTKSGFNLLNIRKGYHGPRPTHHPPRQAGCSHRFH